MNKFLILIVVLASHCIGQRPTSSVQASNEQFYQALNPYSYELSQFMANENDQLQSEKRYVNSGQSIELICDLPNNMPDGKVVFIKYDNKALSTGLDIREDTDDERFEIGQQYAWEWSLKIKAISEDDTGVYVCKVGSTVIKKFEIIVRVPPRINHQQQHQQQHQPKRVREGESVEFSCFATGTPRPNITWFQVNADAADNGVDHAASALSLSPLPQFSGSSFMRVENVTRRTARLYQCRASNNIPPSDTRNFTFSVEFPPEIEVHSKLDRELGTLVLNCTINAFPLTNRLFWRKDGNYVSPSVRHEIRNLRISENLLVSQLLIKSYDDRADQGLYECTAENDLRVAKVVYSLRERGALAESVARTRQQQQQQPVVDLMPIGYSNSSGGRELLLDPGSTRHHAKSRKFNLNGRRKSKSSTTASTTTAANEDESFFAESQQSLETSRLLNQRKHQRNHKNLTKSGPSLEKMLFGASSSSSSAHSSSTPSTSNINSPYVILINEETGSDLTETEPEENLRTSDRLSLEKSPPRASGVASEASSLLLNAYFLVLVSCFIFLFQARAT